MIDPIAIRIGPLELHWYGIIIASAVLLGGLIGSRVARWVGEDPDDGWSMLLPVVVFAVIGARIYHVIHLWDHYAANPIEIPQIWNGGVAIPGAVAGGALAIIVFGRLRGLNIPRWMDIFAVGLLLGQAVGRLGNFVNQELYGPPTDLPWGIPIDAAHRVAPWDPVAFPVDTTRFHPLFAYEALLNLLGMLVLILVIRRFGPRLFTGDIILMYVMWYGAVRTALEPFREDNWIILGVPTAMWIGIVGFVLAAAWLVIRHRRGRGTPLIRPPDEGPTDAADMRDAADAPAERPHPDAEPSPG